ncbi:MAG: Lrp/AsnC family transcriptional regulator [Candidatus Lokiarchaeota archaeon]|nr:Lrp/AsnC family transcriptional regulator [Candidatus Lokiarchaeota archaeon]
MKENNSNNNLSLIKNLNSQLKPNFSKISEKLDMSRQTIKRKLTKLREEKIISNFTINIHPNTKPNLKYILLEIKTNPKEPKMVEKLLQIPQLKMLDGIFGEFSLIALFIFKTSAEFNEILNLIDNIMSNSYFKKYQITEIIKVYKTNGIELSKRNLNDYIIDHIDQIILEILENSQSKKLISTYDINRILNKNYNLYVSQSTIYNRIRKLEDNHIILNYSITFNPKKIGFNGKFIVRIKPKDPSKYNEIALKLENKPEITHLYRIGAQFGIFAVIRTYNIEDYGNFIRDLYITEEIEDTFTNFVLDEQILFTNFIVG